MRVIDGAVKVSSGFSRGYSYYALKRSSPFPDTKALLSIRLLLFLFSILPSLLPFSTFVSLDLSLRTDLVLILSLIVRLSRFVFLFSTVLFSLLDSFLFSSGGNFPWIPHQPSFSAQRLLLQMPIECHYFMHQETVKRSFNDRG